MKNIIVVLAMICSCFVVSSCKSKVSTGVKKVYKMQIGHAQPLENPRHISLEDFKKRVEKRTHGGVVIEIYPEGQLGNEKQMMDLVVSGEIQGFRGGQFDFLPKLAIFSLPFLTENTDQIDRLLSSDFASRIANSSLNAGLVVLGLGDAGGYRQLSNNVRQITKPEDVAGLSFRINGLDTTERTLKALDASVKYIPYNDLYVALKNGDVDGQDNPWVNDTGMYFYEVQKYFTKIDYQFHPDPFYVNAKWFYSLPEEYQKIIKECTVDMFKLNNKLIADKQKDSLEKIKQHSNVYELNALERHAFKTCAQSVYDQYISEGLLTEQELEIMQAIINHK